MLTPNERDRGWRGAYLNGALWSLGNGLVSTTLITFLAKDYGANSFQVGLILACPHLFGMVRLLAPPLLDRWQDRRLFSVVAFLFSGLSLVALPWLSWPGVLSSKSASLTALIALWAAWHVWMYVGLVAFFSWLGDLSPSDERSRRFGAREARMTACTIAGTLLAAWLTQWWNQTHEKPQQWIGLALTAAAGSAFVLLSVLPLAAMPHQPRLSKVAILPSGREMLAALTDRRFLPLLLFNVWFSFANGISGAAIGLFPYSVLKLTAPTLLWLTSSMRVGQVIAAPLAGRLLDRASPRWLMAGSQVVVAAGLLFYLAASPERWWWIAGAWTCWIAYVVLNIGLPSLTLQLSPDGNSPAYVAVIMAASGASFAVASVLGGWLLDYLKGHPLVVAGLPQSSFATLFIVGFVLRLLAAGWLLGLPKK